MYDYLWGLLGAVSGAIALYIVQEFVAVIRSRSGELTGEWEQRIAANPETIEPERIDDMRIRQIGNQVFTTTTRLRPEARRGKQWAFRGELRRYFLFGTYIPLKGNESGSYGTA